ncbi:uncharacterized protein LOC141899482 [Tubulanus polymorphus]|uniref:uncharacterized protein LOC141899482 n=1 Tax=Tubulanus polymorphus TaxID=672921 RepID=UPI003DA54900
MHLSMISFCLATCVFSAFATYIPKTVAKNQSSLTLEKRMDPATAISIALPIIKAIVTPFVEMIFGKLFGPKNYVDDMLTGRAIRIYTNEDGSVKVLDRASGVSVKAKSENKEEAVEEACEKLITKLLELEIMSIYDLKIPFTTTTTATPCHNTHHLQYCENLKKSGFCATGHVNSKFSHMVCYKTCTGC